MSPKQLKMSQNVKPMSHKVENVFISTNSPKKVDYVTNVSRYHHQQSMKYPDNTESRVPQKVHQNITISPKIARPMHNVKHRQMQTRNASPYNN